MSCTSKALLRGLAVASMLLLPAGHALGAQVLWTAPGTTVYMNPGETLEFENPLAGTETIQGYPVLEWLDADYAAGDPPWYDDWWVNDTSIDGDANQIWMRRAGHQIYTASTVPSAVVSIHLPGDDNDGLADVYVDGSLVAQLDMGTIPGADYACVLVTGLPYSTHDIEVHDMGVGQYGQDDVATFGAAVLQAPVVKWTQRPDLDVTGMDVHATYGLGFEPRVLADDFECTVTGPLTEIDIWGSWYFDNLPYGEPTNVTFRLSIHEDIPDPDGPGPLYSMPGELLWMRDFSPGEFEVERYADNLEEWYVVPGGQALWPGDYTCWLYRFFLDPTDFRQEGTPQTPVIYWLDVQAFPNEDYRHFGWKSSVDHWNDDAVWGEGQDPPAVWYELDYPGLHQFPEDAPLDLAFRIIGEAGQPPPEDHVVCEPQPPDHPTEYWYEVVRSTDWYCDFHVRVYDPDPCQYSNWNVPSGWVFAVHEVNDEWWASWWDPTDGCPNAITGTYTFRFSNPNASVWGDWTITQGNSSDPYYMVLDDSGAHSGDPDGYGYRVHVPSEPGAEVYKWVQTPDLNPTGMDVLATYHQFVLPMVVLADDFECTATEQITEITVWGSWLGDYYPMDDPGNVAFRLSIHSDNPAGPGGWSEPADLLWIREFYPGDFAFEPCAVDLDEGFYTPPWEYYPSADTVCWKYTFPLDPEEFIQEGSPGAPVVYWLDVQALVDDPEARFGWKTSLDHWNDDAVWAEGEDGPWVMDWQELRYPVGYQHPFEGESIDLAFAITAEEWIEDEVVCEPQPPDHPTEYWYKVSRATDWYCDFHVRVYDPDPCNYSNWNVPAGWVFAVHQVGDEWWASWWDPTDGCLNAITGTNIFRFTNSNPAVWGDWTITQGNSSDPYYMVLDDSAVHAGDPDGYGYRVHVPLGEEEDYKWIQTPDLNPTGMDVYASNQFGAPQLVLADDFECTATGDITEIVVWGSWLEDHLPEGDAGNVMFRLSIHSDYPGPPYSMPADLLWMQEFYPGEFGYELCVDGLEEGFLFPPSEYLPLADSVCWKYRFPLAPGEFVQQGSPGDPIIYWLDLQAFPIDPLAIFGWKTSLDHWNDDAVWAEGEDGPWVMDWQELRYPPGHPFEPDSIDLAFAIAGAACPSSNPPTQPPGEAGFDKNRYISFVPDNAGMQVAFRVTLLDMPPPFEGDEGCRLWVGEPGAVSESSGDSGPTPPPTFMAAQLQVDAYCMDWSAIEVLHVYDDEIVPGARYEVQAIECSCDFAVEANYSAPLIINTARWGDIGGVYAGTYWTAPDGDADFDDITMLVDKFKNLPGAPIKARADIAPDMPDQIVDFIDIPWEVDAFRGLPYPFDGPDECP